MCQALVRRLLRLSFMAFTCLAFGGCAALQEVRYLDHRAEPGVVPTVVGAQGALSRKSSRTLLASRWKNSYADAQALATVEELATGRPLIAGNAVTLLYDGPQTMASMMQAIGAAKDHINLETYIFDQDPVGLQFADLLMERQRSGVQVHIIYDAIGTIGTPQEFFDRMREAGIHLVAFNPVNPLKLVGPWAPNNRDHRKILVVDGRVAFTGGVNISSTYSNSSLFRSKSRSQANVGWRDTHIRIEGPAVAALQWEFLNSWVGQQAPALSDANFFPPLPSVGDKLVRILASAPQGDQDIYAAYLLAISAAEKSVHITCAYFVPDVQILKALTDAARRGVDVKIILPGVLESGLVFHAGRSFYADLLASGVRVYELQIAVLHAKTAVVDRIWSTVGSTNIDMRSFLHNYELNAVVLDPAFGSALESAFEEDLRYSVEVSAAQWAQRPFADRVKEWAARRLEYWL
ncbi:MAG: cardiolipin synthase [Burkholderiaceae bacterium]|nr:cardiolipin synthase [Burkholderiaceae bacterium]